MTAAELIAELEKFPGDTLVLKERNKQYESDDWSSPMEADTVEEGVVYRYHSQGPLVWSKVPAGAVIKRIFGVILVLAPSQVF